MMHVHDFQTAIDKLKPFLVDYLIERDINPDKLFTCPFPDHNDDTPSCNVVAPAGESPRFYCHGCGKTGDIFDAVQLYENKPKLGIQWVEETLKYLALKYGVEVQTKDLTEEQVYELDTFRAYRAAAELVKATDLDPEVHIHFLKHLKKRQWTTETLTDMGVGTVKNFSYFRESLKAQGFSASFLDEVDLGRKDIFNEDNMIFTWRDEHSRCIGFTSRNLLFEQQKKEAAKTGQKITQPKYNNQRTTGLKCNIFQKGRRFYGLDGAIKTTPPLYIFEGQTDVITARRNGLLNCVAVAGSSLHVDHVLLLKDLGIYDVILCLDGDATGQKKLAQILEERFAGHREMRVRVIMLPEKEDPDSFIRKEGIEAFRKLACWSAFEWRLNQYGEDDDVEIICKQMIPFIVNESSPIVRERLSKALANRTGITLRSIQQELEILVDAKALKRSRERQEILDRAMYDMRQAPNDAELILQRAQASLSEVVKKHDSDSLSNEDFVRDLDEQKAGEEKNEQTDANFELGQDLRELQEVLRGEWSRDVFMCFGGKPNVGKSAILSKIAYSIATNNPDVCVLYHTIDDTRHQLVPRFVTIAEGSHDLSINMVRQPRYWSEKMNVEGVTEKRNNGYAKIRQLAHEGRLIVKDISHGGTLPFAENLICYYQDKYPDRRIVYILDNVHKLRDFEGKDERVRFKSISEACKSIALRKRVCFMGSVEYTKLAPGIRPTNHNIGECLTGDTEVFITDTGSYCRIDEVKTNMKVATLGDNQQIVDKKVLAKLDKGKRKVYKVTTKTGRILETTMNHPFYSEDGWTKLSNLNTGSWLGIPRSLLNWSAEKDFSNDLARLLGYLAGDGSYSVSNQINQTPSFINQTREYLDDVTNIVKKHFNVEVSSKDYNGSKDLRFSRINGTEQENPVVSWLKKLGIHGQTGVNKKVPDIIYNSTRLAKVNYLAGLFATDGSITDNKNHRISFANKSLNLIKGCQRLLLHVGIQSSISGSDKNDMYKVVILGSQAIRFAELIPLKGYKGKLLLDLLINKKKTTNTGDVLPPVFTKLIKEARTIDNQSVRYSDGYWIQKETINRSRAQKLCTEIKFGQKILEEWAHSDIFWDKIESIEEVGEKQVWDLVVEGTHNFIANDIFCHNTGQIEYDANFIAHVYSEVSDLPDSFTVCHRGVDWKGANVLLPRVELIVGKNKITEEKKSLFLDFWPSASDYRYVSQETVIADSKAEKTNQRNGTTGADKDELLSKAYGSKN